MLDKVTNRNAGNLGIRFMYSNQKILYACNYQYYFKHTKFHIHIYKYNRNNNLIHHQFQAWLLY
jgi:hypothetical protein